MAKNSRAQAATKDLFEAKADQMNLGLDLNTDRNLKWGQISSASQALRYERGAGAYTSPGYIIAATPNGAVGYGGSLETTKVKHALWVAVGTKIMYTESLVADNLPFYDTGVSITAGLLQGFCEGPDGDVFSSNNTDSPLRFAVGITKAAVTASGDIDVGTAYYTKFSASGTVYMNGVAVTYSGKDGTSKLTGTNAPVTASGVLVVQSSNPGTWTQKGNILISVEHSAATGDPSMLIMGVKDYESVVYYTGAFTIANPQFFYDTASNGGGAHVMPRNITAAIRGSGSTLGYIFMEKGVHKINGFDAVMGTLQTSELTHEYGAYNAKCVVDMDGRIAFLGQKRLIPIDLTIGVTGAIPQLNGEFDDPLRPWLLSLDDITSQANANLKWDSTNKILKISASVNGANQTYLNDAHNPGFLPRERRNIGTSCMYLGNSYFGHTDNGNLYLDDFGRTNDGIPISHVISTGRIEYDRGRRFLKGKEFRFEGWATPGVTMTLRCYLDGASDAVFTVDFLSDDYFTARSGRPLGLRSQGISQPGGNTQETTTVYPLTIPLGIRGINAEDFRFEWEISGDGAFFQLNTWYFSAEPTRKQPRTIQ